MPGILQTDGANGVAPGSDPSQNPTSDDSLPPVEEFVVVNQEVSIDINFREQSVQGESRITIYLTNPDDPPDEVALDARQSEIDTTQIRVNGKSVRATYRDPYESLDLPPSWDLTPSNFPVLKSRMRNLLPKRRRDLPVEKREQVGCNPADRSLRVRLRPEPPKPANAAPGSAADAGSSQQPGKLKVRLSTVGLTDTTTNGNDSKTDSDQPTDGLFEIVIPFKTTHIRDGLHFVGVEDSDTRFPHVYTRHSPEPGIAACIFPCLDDPGSRCFWKIHIKTPRTLGDALMQQLASNQSMNDAAAAAADAAASNDKSITVNGNQGKQQVPLQNGQGGAKAGHRQLQLTEEDKLLDMTVVCSGNLVGEKVDEADESKKIMTFEITDHGAAANQIGFAVGPFEHVDLYTGFRTDEDDEKLGASALKIHGYCLPGRQVEVQNTCVSLTTAADEFAMTYGRYPYDSFKLCFVDDMVSDTTPLLSFSLCSTRLLFPDSIVERDFDVTRKLVHSLAYQYFGSYIVPNQRAEMWLTVGIAYYMTDLFLCKLCGNNDYRFRIKSMSDRLAEEDRDRPSLHDLGTYTYLGDFEMEFMALKAPLVLFILDKRLTKAAGSASASLARVISKIISKANTSGWGDNNNEIISSESFRRVCEKTSQYQLEAFWNQWVLGSGCPWLTIKQRFNRKRLCVEIGIHQTQETAAAKPRPMHHAEFWRELVEKRHGTYARKVQRLFTGPMTIRIHEANGTPYEHIVEIRDDAAFTGGAKFDIPYNTKYKRLKRNRRNREKAAALAANNADNNNSGGANAENNDDMIVFSLGDKLDTPDEMAAWGLIDWTEQDEKSMDQESYEWIRIDSDFEWISKIHTNMPAWMYLSQLQQDRDIVAQQDTLLYLSRIREHAMSATILTRTLYDDRYFHGLRTMAAENLTRQVWKMSDTPGGGNSNDDENGDGAGQANGGSGNESIVYRGLEQLMHVFRRFHCYDDATAKPNDFTDMRRYWVQCAVIDAISKVHFEDKRPREAQRFLLDILRFNNNAQNLFSDHLYVARVIVALATSFCNTSSAATQTGANSGNGSSNKNGASGKRDRGKMDMVLTFDDGMSDDDDASDDFDNLGADIDRMEVDTEDQQLLEAALAEIERYRRMDEWTSSYQNAWTTATLEAKRKLMKTGVIPVDALEFVRYLQDGTIDSVQLKAFEALIDLGLMLRPVILKLLLSTMTTHTSPFMRDQLFKHFSKGLASIAFGEHTGSSSTAVEDKKKDQVAITNGGTNGTNGDAAADKKVKTEDEEDDDDDTGGLIIEQGDTITKKHQEEHARRENIDAAVAALREAVKGNQELLSTMWDAVLSPVTGCTEKRNLLDLLEVMFDGDLSLLLTVKHPTMWTATRKATPGGVIDFKKIPRPLKAKPPPVSTIAAAQPVQAGVAPASASASSATQPPLSTTVPASSTAVTAGSAAAMTSASANSVATPVRTALPGAPAKKPTMPKIKLQTSRISLGGAGSPAPSPAVGTPIVIKKPSVATPAPAAAAPATPAPAAKAAPAASSSSSVLPSLTKREREREGTADSIAVQPAQRKSSVAATPSAAARMAKSPTPANDYFGNFTSRMGKTPQPAASPALSTTSSVNNSSNNTNKRKRQDSLASFDSAGGSGGHRPRKLLKIAVPLSYQHKLSPRASHWLETYRTPTPTTNNNNSTDGDSIRAAGFVSPTKKASTPHSTSSKHSHSGHHRGSATPGPHHSSSTNNNNSHHSNKPLPSSKPPRGPTPTTASSSKAGSPVKRESATPDASSSFKPARKPLPGTVTASSSASPAPAVQAPPAPPPPPTAGAAPKAATPAPSTPAATPASKPIFIKFKSKTNQ